MCHNLSENTYVKKYYNNNIKTLVTIPNASLLRSHSFLGSAFISLVHRHGN
jgi:hypothetical protein